VNGSSSDRSCASGLPSTFRSFRSARGVLSQCVRRFEFECALWSDRTSDDDTTHVFGCVAGIRCSAMRLLVCVGPIG
jgi:hypothetical protein